MPEVKPLTISENLYKLLEEVKKRKEAELGHEISFSDLLAEILKEKLKEEEEP